MYGRVFLTACAGAGYWFFEKLMNPMVTLAQGKLAGMQLNPSDYDYVSSTLMSNLVSNAGTYGFVAFLLALMFIWVGPLKRFLVSYKDDATKASMVLLIGLGLLLVSQKSYAYYDTYDYAENYYILPNESAFYIPDVGDNKTSQAAFMSEKYLQDNKIAAKKFTMPHVKIPKTGWTLDSYGPAGRLILVDRAPTTRVWVDAHDRGTNAKKEGFPCQDNGGLDITVGISIGATVHEENAPKFLYNFGVEEVKGNRIGDKPDPNVVFQSVYTGRSLHAVMDSNVRDKVHSLVCDEMSIRPLEENNTHAKEIMADIETKTKEYLNSVGITLLFIGWADTFTFDPVIQDSLNRTFSSKKNAEIAKLMSPHVGTLQGLAWADTIRESGKKWNGAIPSSLNLALSVFDGLKDWVKGFFPSWGSNAPPAPTAPAN